MKRKRVPPIVALVHGLDKKGHPVKDFCAFAGQTPLDIVRAMRGDTMFGSQRSVAQYISATAKRAKRLYGLDIFTGSGAEANRARAFLASLESLGIVEFIRNTRKGGK